MTYCQPPEAYSFLTERRAIVTPLGVMYAVWKIMGIDRDRIMSKSRKREIVNARHIYCLVLKTRTTMTLKAIGETLNGRDHTTVLNAVNTAQDLIDTEPQMRAYYNQIISSL